MAAITPYETEFDFSEYPGKFTDGEMALHIQPKLNAAPGGTKWWLSRRMEFEGGMYTIKAMVDDAATWWVGRRASESYPILHHALRDGMISSNVYFPPGYSRIDIVIDNLPLEINPTFIQFSLWKDGGLVYVSTSKGWLADYSLIPDSVLESEMEDPFVNGAVFSILPNWKFGITERLSWSTDIMQSESGAEQRRAVRVAPRRSLEVSFLRKGESRNILDRLLVGVHRAGIMIPLWHEAVRMMSGVRPDSMGVSFADSDPTSVREFRKGDFVFVNNGDPLDYEILKVGEVESHSFSWESPPTKEWPKGTRIYPMRWARILDAPKIDNITDQVGTARIRFTMVGPESIPNSWGNEFADSGIFLLRPNRIDPIEMTYNAIEYTLDNESAWPYVIAPGQYSQAELSASFLLQGRSQLTELRQFLYAAKGQAVAFYVPTYSDDIDIVGDIPPGPYLNVDTESFRIFLKYKQPIRLMIGILTHDFGWIVRIIISAEVGRFLLNEPISVTADQVIRVCFISPARFAQDSFEFEHITSESKVVTTKLRFLQMTNRRTEIV